MAPNVGHRWQRGAPSPNPKGRPKTGTAFAEAVREHVDPLELIRLALEIARGEPSVRDVQHLRNAAVAKAKGEPPPAIEGVEVAWPTNAERLSAIAFLHGSAWQKPAQGVVVSTGDEKPAYDYSKLTPAELDQLESALSKALGIVDVAPGLLESHAPKPA